MKYVLDERLVLRGWERAPFAVFNTLTKQTAFAPKEQFIQLMRCDGAHDMDLSSMEGPNGDFLRSMEAKGVIRPARLGEFLLPEQEYRRYPARYKRNAHWSITGSCNLRCRHCFMSAPHAKHGNPTHEQLMGVVDQLAECGVFQVGLTGGEPLIREDFLDIVEALTERGIGIDVIYTNGWLVDEQLLDALDKASPDRKTPFQLSFDGVGRHDFLRGVPGAEERALDALKLLQEHEHPVNVSFCLHRGNMDVVRDTVRLLASLGVRGMKVGTMMGLGEWMNPELRDLELTREETFAFFERYIPQYFEDDAPMSIMLSGVFTYSPGNPSWSSFLEARTTAEERKELPTCGSLVPNFYIGADGVVAPCMGMADCGIASTLPNLYKTPLREILGDSELMRMGNATVADVHDGNDECRACAFKDRCAGGCRNSVLMECDDYYGADHDACWFFKHDGPERIRTAAEGPFAAYTERHPPRQGPDAPDTFGDSGQNCP